MTGEVERAEGQALAAVILTALDGTGGAKPDWTPFVTAYETDLLATAVGLRRRYRGLQSLEPAEIVQAFLAAKVFPPERARVLLGVVARGEQPLKPRLLTSLGTYCVDLHRSRVRQPPSGSQLPELTTAQAIRPTVEEVETLASRQVAAVRAAFDRTPTRAPYRAALLLFHRGEWVWVLSGVVLSGPSGHGEATLSVERVVALTMWSEDEANQLLGDGDDA